MENLLSIKFWINIRPGALSPVFGDILIGIIILLLATGIIISFIKKSRKYKAYNSFLSSLIVFSFSNTAIGSIVWFFTYEMIPLLSARFWFIFWGAGMAVWLYFIFKMISKVSEKKERIAKEEEYKKYIP